MIDRQKVPTASSVPRWQGEKRLRKRFTKLVGEMIDFGFPLGMIRQLVGEGHLEWETRKLHEKLNRSLPSPEEEDNGTLT
jgi:hypothetical protein